MCFISEEPMVLQPTYSTFSLASMFYSSDFRYVFMNTYGFDDGENYHSHLKRNTTIWINPHWILQGICDNIWEKFTPEMKLIFVLEYIIIH